MMMRSKSLESLGASQYRFFIIVVATLLYVPFLGAVHLFDWDEINFAESAREMLVSGDLLTVKINFEPFWEKPPLFIWLQVLSMKLFGVNEFAARFPNAIIGIVSLLVTFEIGKLIKDNFFGLIFSVAFGLSALPLLYFKSGIIDPLFNLSIFASIFFAFQYLVKAHFLSGILSAVILGLAVLTKGPAAMAIALFTLVPFYIIERKRLNFKLLHFIFFVLILLLVGFSYHFYQAFNGNWFLITDFFEYQLRLLKTEDAGHGGSVFYHPTVLLFGVFPTSVFAIFSVAKLKLENDLFKKLMFILFLVVLVIFSLAKTKIIHYSSLCYFPMAYLAATGIYHLIKNDRDIPRLYKVLIFVLASVYVLAPGLIQIIATFEDKTLLTNWIKDPFAIDSLSRVVNWSGYEFTLGIALLAALIIFVYTKFSTRNFMGIYFSVAIFCILFFIVFVPKIEKYSQGAHIEFIEKAKSENAPITTLNFKSYAPFFYSGKTSATCQQCNETQFLLNSNQVTKSYFVCKTIHLEEILKTHQNLEYVTREGGFILLKKKDL